MTSHRKQKLLHVREAGGQKEIWQHEVGLLKVYLQEEVVRAEKRKLTLNFSQFMLVYAACGKITLNEINYLICYSFTLESLGEI